MSLLDKIGEGLHDAKAVGEAAWKPFGYAYEKDAAAGDWVAGALLKQRMEQLGGAGVPLSETDKQIMSQRNGQAFRTATEDQPLARMIGELGYSPSSILGILGMGAPEVAGATNSLRFAQKLPEAMKVASGGERVGLAAEAANRALGAPFEGALRMTAGQAHPNSVLRKIPAIDHAFQLSGESLAKLEARTIGNALSLLKERGVDLDALLGRTPNTVTGQTSIPTGPAPHVPGAQATVPGGPVPGRPSGARTAPLGTNPAGASAAAVAVPSTPFAAAPAAAAAATGAATVASPAKIAQLTQQLAAATDPQEQMRLLGELQALGVDMSSAHGGALGKPVGEYTPAAAAPANPELDALYEQLSKATTEEEYNAVIQRIDAIENPVANPADPMDDLIRQFEHESDPAKASALWDQMEAIEGPIPATEMSRERFYEGATDASPAPPTADVPTEPALGEAAANPAEGQAPDAGLAGPGAEPSTAAAEAELNPDGAAPPTVLHRWGIRQAVASHAKQADDYTIVLKLARAAGVDDERLPSVIKALFGDVQVGRAGYNGYYSGTRKKLAAQFEKEGMSAADALVHADTIIAYNAKGALKAQSEDRLSDLIAYFQAKAKERGVIPADKLEHYADMPSSEDIKKIVQGGGVPDAASDVVPPTVPDTDAPTSGLPDVAGGSGPIPAGPAATNPNHPLWQAHPNHPGRPPTHPGVDLPDETVDAINQHKDKLLEAIEEHGRDKQEVTNILAAAQAASPTYDPTKFRTTEEAIAAAKGLISKQAHDRADQLATKWRDIYETDLLKDDRIHAVGKHAMVGVAREQNPGDWSDKTKFGGKFLRDTIPQAWKEQALLTPRFLAGNAMDIIFKSLMHGLNPFMGFNLSRRAAGEEGTALKAGLPRLVDAFAAKLRVPIPVELTDTFHDSLVGKGDASIFRSKWKHYNPIAWLSEANLSLNKAIELAARTSVWVQGTKDQLAKLGKGQLEYLIRMANVDQATADTLRTIFHGQEWSMSPEDAEALLLHHGVDPQWAGRFRKQWQNVIQKASNAGVDLSNHIHFDYAERTNLDKWAASVMPFHFWASRNLPFYLQHLAEQPALAAAWLRYNRIADEQQKRNHLPARFKGFLSLGGNGIVDMLFGQHGVLGVDPSAIMSVTGQINGDPYQDDSQAGVYQVLQQIKAKTGLGVGPIPEFVANITGLAGDRPLDPSLVRLGPTFEKATGHMNPIDWLATRGANALRGGLTQQDTSSISVSQGRDWQIRRRIMELAVEQGSGPTDPKYVAALTDGTSPIWKQAAQDVVDRSAGQNILGSINPLPAKFAGDTEIAVQEAKDTLGPAFVPGETPEQTKARLDQQAKDDPERSGLRDLYRPTGATTEETKLKQGLAQWETHKAFWANKPAKAAAAAHDDFFKLYPIVAEYFQWLEQKKARGEPAPTGDTIKEFLQNNNSK